MAEIRSRTLIITGNVDYSITLNIMHQTKTMRQVALNKPNDLKVDARLPIRHASVAHLYSLADGVSSSQRRYYLRCAG